MKGNMYPINAVGGSIVESAEPSIQHSMRFGRQDYALRDPLQYTIYVSRNLFIIAIRARLLMR